MARCTSCQTRWKAKDIWRLGFSKQGKACSVCGERQYISAKTQKMMTLGYISLAFALFFPFIIKLSNKDEPFF
ncbi:hypothetical protein [Bacillus sp. CGMCC 1.16541]|uniref:hypothetical protein n=1 Tax=Bacillus sp. CGMCC 1.16541 TaxID=2185143 RepID=UPI000D72E006|nr:hypothetical protein [Bacillus sp. CGMCC 1.16541]